MKAKHTPGPWTWHPTALHPAVRSVGTPDAGPRRICTVGTMNGNPVDKANARLIAAAPELLEALQAVLRSFPTDRDMRDAGWERAEIDLACSDYEAARAAIAKVSGGGAFPPSA
mgnify:CR=1 FL=1